MNESWRLLRGIAIPWLLIHAFPFCAWSELPESSSLPNPITIYTDFEQDPAAQSIDEMKSELEAIMQPVGLHMEWRPLRPLHSEVFAELVVVKFKGACDVESWDPSRADFGSLGWTHITDGDILPFTDVQCDRIRNLIRPELLRLPAGQHQRIFGRAVARVPAHELYHILANTTVHTASGVSKKLYSTLDLVWDEFRFNATEVETLRNRKQRALLTSKQARSGGSAGKRE
jgi:hypothetical protein